MPAPFGPTMPIWSVLPTNRRGTVSTLGPQGISAASMRRSVLRGLGRASSQRSPS